MKFYQSCIIIALAAVLMATNVRAESPYLVDGRTGKYLGNLNRNSLDPNSVSNPVGRYGSPVSPDSINNPVGRYGSPLSNDSVNNPFATNSPRIYAPRQQWGSDE